MERVAVVEADLENPAHQGAVLHLIRSYARDIMGRGEDLPEAVQREMVSGLRRHPTSIVFLAFDGDEAVGVAVCFVGFSTFAARSLINIHDLAVVAEHRRKGIGRRLLEAVAQRGRELGCCKLTLEVRGDNTTAQRLYRALGFDRDGAGKMLFWEKSLGG